MRGFFVGISLLAVSWIGLDAAHAVTNTTVEVGLGICRHAGAVSTAIGCSYCNKVGMCTDVACDKNGCSVTVLPAKAPPPGGGRRPGPAAPIQSGPEKSLSR